MNMDTTRDRFAIDRRRFLQGSAFAGFAAFLAACSSSGSSSSLVASTAPAPSAPPASAAPSASEAAASATPQTPTGPLNFANWDAYIDLTTVPGPDGKLDTDDDEYDLPSPTVDDLKTQYVVDLHYDTAATV